MNIPDSEKIFLSDFRIAIPELTEWTGTFQNTGFFVENGHITRLSLRRLNLTELPNSIGNLKELRILFLTSNHLINLPESFKNLSNLKNLQLGGNKFQALPDWFGNFKNLQELDLCANELLALPETIGNLENLTWISLGPNKISVLPESFKYLKKLQYLDLEDAGLRSFSNIPEEFIDSIDSIEEPVDWECFSSKGNYPSKHAKESIGKNENIYEIWNYYHVSPLELAAKYALDQDSLTDIEKNRLAWEGGWRERHLIEAEVDPDDWVLVEINKRRTITCNNGLELIK